MLSLIRIRLEEGLIVRSALAPGMIDSSRKGSLWTARVEPSPTPDLPITISLDLWRSLPGEQRSGGGDLSHDRQLPLFEPIGVARFSGELGFRRPGDWVGGLPQAEGSNPISEDAFVAAWGELPEELALSGVMRFVGAPKVSAPVGPAPFGRTTRSEVALELGVGRIEVRSATVLENQAGRSFDVDVEIPEDFRVKSVEARGLTCWSRDGNRRLRLWFDGVAAPRQEIVIQGWMPVKLAREKPSELQQKAKIFWPMWSNANDQPGTLSIQSPVRFELEPPQVDVGEDGSEGAAFRSVYRIDRPRDLGVVAWTVEPRTTVEATSLVTLLPDSAELAATIRYDVQGGSLDAIYLQFPSDWAENATLVGPGAGSIQTIDSLNNNKTWKIEPSKPIFGPYEIRIQSRRSWNGSSALSFPRISPLGSGTVKTKIAVANASGLTVDCEPAGGLRPIDESQIVISDLPTILWNKNPTKAYEVRKEDWSLRVRAAAARSARREASRGIRISQAEATCVVGPVGDLVGEVVYDLAQASAPFFEANLPEGCEVIWASVDQEPTRAYRIDGNRWLTPIAEKAASRICLVWRDPLASSLGKIRIPTPECDGRTPPTLLAVHAPEDWRFTPADRAAETLPAGLYSVEVVEHQARRLMTSFQAKQPASSNPRRLTSEELTNFELLVRSAARSASASGVGARALARIQAARTSVEEAALGSGLEQFLEQAWVQAGMSETKTKPLPSAAAGDARDASRDPRLRLRGPARYYRCEAASSGKDGLVVVRSRIEKPTQYLELAAMVVLALLTLGFLFLEVAFDLQAPAVSDRVRHGLGPGVDCSDRGLRTGIRGRRRCRVSPGKPH